MNILVFVLITVAVAGGLTMVAAGAVSMLSRASHDKLVQRLGKIGLIMFLVGAVPLFAVALAALGYTVLA